MHLVTLQSPDGERYRKQASLPDHIYNWGKSTPTEHPYTLIYRLRSANEGNTDMGVP